MNFEKDNYEFGQFSGRIHRNFRLKEELLKNKKAKKHLKKLLDIAEKEADKEIDKRYHEIKKRVNKRIRFFRKIVEK